MASVKLISGHYVLTWKLVQRKCTSINFSIDVLEQSVSKAF